MPRENNISSFVKKIFIETHCVPDPVGWDILVDKAGHLLLMELMA